MNDQAAVDCRGLWDGNAPRCTRCKWRGCCKYGLRNRAFICASCGLHLVQRTASNCHLLGWVSLNCVTMDARDKPSTISLFYSILYRIAFRERIRTWSRPNSKTVFHFSTVPVLFSAKLPPMKHLLCLIISHCFNVFTLFFYFLWGGVNFLDFGVSLRNIIGLHRFAE